MKPYGFIAGCLLSGVFLFAGEERAVLPRLTDNGALQVTAFTPSYKDIYAVNQLVEGELGWTGRDICFPKAQAMGQRLEQAGLKAYIACLYGSTASGKGHAVLVGKAEGVMWLYDPNGDRFFKLKDVGGVKESLLSALIEDEFGIKARSGFKTVDDLQIYENVERCEQEDGVVFTQRGTNMVWRYEWLKGTYADNRGMMERMIKQQQRIWAAEGLAAAPAGM